MAGVDLTSELNTIWEAADIKQAHYYVTEIELTNYPQVLSAIEGGLVQIELELQVV